MIKDDVCAASLSLQALLMHPGTPPPGVAQGLEVLTVEPQAALSVTGSWRMSQGLFGNSS